MNFMVSIMNVQPKPIGSKLAYNYPLGGNLVQIRMQNSLHSSHMLVAWYLLPPSCAAWWPGGLVTLTPLTCWWPGNPYPPHMLVAIPFQVSPKTKTLKSKTLNPPAIHLPLPTPLPCHTSPPHLPVSAL